MTPRRLRHVPLVSRRFAEACRDPTLWPKLHVAHAAFLSEATWRGFLRWLAHRASGLQMLMYGKSWGVRHSHTIFEPQIKLVICHPLAQSIAVHHTECSMDTNEYTVKLTEGRPFVPLACSPEPRKSQAKELTSGRAAPRSFWRCWQTRRRSCGAWTSRIPTRPLRMLLPRCPRSWGASAS